MWKRREREDALSQMRKAGESAPAQHEPPGQAPRMSPTVVRIAVLAIVALSLALRALPGGESEDPRERGPAPYTFSYPGSWRATPKSELPPTTLENVRGIDRGEDGILVGTFEPASREQVLRATRDQWAASGVKLLRQRQVTVAGVEGVQLDGAKNDIRDRTTILYGSAFMAYWIKCFTPDDHRATWAACDEVLRTFRLRSRSA